MSVYGLTRSEGSRTVYGDRLGYQWSFIVVPETPGRSLRGKPLMDETCFRFAKPLCDTVMDITNHRPSDKSSSRSCIPRQLPISTENGAVNGLLPRFSQLPPAGRCRFCQIALPYAFCECDSGKFNTGPVIWSSVHTGSRFFQRLRFPIGREIRDITPALWPTAATTAIVENYLICYHALSTRKLTR
jgi:hypothetical protein